MNSFAEELLEGVNIGDFVCVRYGTDTDQQTYTGEVIKIAEFFLHLRSVERGISKIRLDDSLRTLNWVQKPNETSQPKETKSHPETTTPTHANGSNVPSAPVKASVRTELTRNDYHISRQIATLPVASSFPFSVADGLSLLQTLFRQLNNTVFKSGVNGIMDSLSYAIKTHSMQEKYHNLKARTLAQWDNCSEKREYDFFYLLLAYLSIFAEDYAKALEPLVRVRKFSLAAYIASSAKDPQSAELFSLCALLAREDGAEITQYTSEICVKRKDSNVLLELLKVYHDNREACERITACAYNLFRSCGGTLKQDITPYDDGYQAATKILEALPTTCKNKSEILEKWKKFDLYSFPEKQAPAQPEMPKREVGGITRFEVGKNKNWGFSGNNFFYISQVRDDTESALLLRKLLFAGCGEGLEISYFITASPIRPGSTTLTDIDLTEKGFEQAQKRVGSAAQYGSNKAGYVAFYNQETESGAIQANGRRYSFQISSIIDPYLRKFYETSFVHLEDQHVIFEVKGQIAQNIRWNEKKRSEGDFTSVRSSVTDEQAKAWSAFLAGLGDQETTVKLPSEDPYKSYPYTPLEEDAPIPNRSKMASPLSWPLNNSPKKQDLRAGEGSSASSAPQSSKSAAAATPKAGKSMSHNAQLYVNKARKMRLNGDLQGAEVYFKKAIDVGGFNEAVMSDFITLYQQMGTDESLQQAVRLIETYEDQYTPEKAVNIKSALSNDVTPGRRSIKPK
ncbi:MAG: hypothetical protein LUG55_01970, partial [Clostridiales bacterium]|nr:hypothetical protein [Clostridiales bacterium]